MAREKQTDNLETLPPEVESHLPEWRERLRLTQPTAAVSDEERTQLCWELGRELAELVPPSAQQGARTRTMTALAEGLSCSRSLVYGLMNVGLIFTRGLLSDAAGGKQSWSWHAAQARRLLRMDPEEREIELQRLAALPGQVVRNVKPARSVSPAEGDGAGLHAQAVDAFLRLDPIAQLFFLATVLSHIGPDSVRDPLGEAYLKEVIVAAVRLQSLLPEPPPRGPAKSGKHGSSSA